jgi:hypothetical protein
VGYLHLDINNTCVQSCPAGFIADSNALNCEVCAPKCTTCENTTSKCTSCASNFLSISVLDGIDCVASCPTNYLTDIALNRCEGEAFLLSNFSYALKIECDASCAACSGSITNCTSCSSSYKSFTDREGVLSCLVECPATYYADINNVCTRKTNPFSPRI